MAPTSPTVSPMAGESARKPQQKYSWRFWSIIIALSIASLLSALDVSVISTAMPSILEDLGSSDAYMWIANAYFLTMTAFQPMYGQTANIFGRRSLTLLAILLFLAGSAVSGAAPTLGALITGRAIQGIGGGGVNILIEIIVADLVPLRERPKFISYIFISYTIAVIMGPVIGGLLAQNVTWRWVFYLNLPIAGVGFVLLALVLRVRYTKDSARNSLKRVDIAGNTLLVASIVAVLLSLTWGGDQYQWSSWRTLVPLILGLLGLISFLWVESTTLIPEPTMPIRLFANRTSLGGYALTFLHGMLTYWMSYFLPVYFQAVKNTGPIRSGVDILPLAALSMPFAIVAAMFVTKSGHYREWFFLGMALLAIANGLLSRLDEDSSTAYWAGCQCIGGAGIGVLTTTTLPAIQAPLTEVDQAITTATWGFVRSFGGVWGVAIPAAVFNSRVNQLVSGINNEDVRAALRNGGAYALASTGGIVKTGNWSPEIKAQVKSIYVQSLKRCWQVALGFSLLGFALSFMIKDVSLRVHLQTDFGLEGDNGEIGLKGMHNKTSGADTKGEKDTKATGPNPIPSAENTLV
ncbi:hypothetical protein VM1G_11193 [Cytospora mali]|uniref:Major facilitator superfamily (MFS) profile domain-containing protein n=1 Tax=Cytospora mali TaxID=578113 RepID=A0A194VJS5_CYTMA|nr:hypothetical protein VM1G_11193 [Valsa mali]